MARSRKDREVNLIHFSFFDLLFGAFGAFVFLMIMQVLASMNLVDADIRQLVDRTVQEKNELQQELLQYQQLDRTLGDLQGQYQQTQAERDRLAAERAAAQAQNQRLDAELDALRQRLAAERGALRQEAGDTLRALEEDKRKLEKSLEQAEQKLAALKTLPLQIKTRAFPTTLTEENVQLALAAEGGSPPYQWELKGALPSGLTFNPNTGLIAGVTQAPGEFKFTLKVTDARGFSTAAQSPVTFKVIRKFEEQHRKVSDWFLIIAGALALFFVYKLWLGYKIRQYIKDMQNKGYKNVWVKNV